MPAVAAEGNGKARVYQRRARDSLVARTLLGILAALERGQNQAAKRMLEALPEDYRRRVVAKSGG